MRIGRMRKEGVQRKKKKEKKSGFYSPSYSASHIVVIKVQAKKTLQSVRGSVGDGPLVSGSIAELVAV